MYLSQHYFTPDPAKFDLWLPYNRNYMALTARAAGAVWSRILRREDDPEKFIAIGLWTDHLAAQAWVQSADAALGAKPAIDQGLYEGFPLVWSRWNLADFAWGWAGPAGLTGPGLFVKHVTWEVAPGRREAQQTLSRGVMSLMARLPGFVSGETYRGPKDDRLLSIYTFRSRDDWPSAESTPADLQMLLKSDTARAVLDNAPAPVALDCGLFESVWGPETARLQGFAAAEPAVA
jgi:quinol monooxygenase YgiN